MKRILALILVCALLLSGCAKQNSAYLVNKLEEHEQRILELEQTIDSMTDADGAGQETLSEEQGESALTETPSSQINEPLTFGDFFDILPDNYVQYTTPDRLSECSILKEYNKYGISVEYIMDSEQEEEDVINYYKQIVGDDANMEYFKSDDIYNFTTPENDSYYIWTYDIDDSDLYALGMEVQFSNADFSSIIDNAELELYKYKLDTIFSMAPTMLKVIISEDESMEKAYYFEYKSLQEDCDDKIKQVYEQYNYEFEENQYELIYDLPDNISVHFDLFDDNRVNVRIEYSK